MGWRAGDESGTRPAGDLGRRVGRLQVAGKPVGDAAEPLRPLVRVREGSGAHAPVGLQVGGAL